MHPFGGLQENLNLVDKFLKTINVSTSGKMLPSGLEIYEHVFERVEYNGNQYLSFYVIGNGSTEFVQKGLFKYSGDRLADKFLLKYKRNHDFSIDKTSLSLEKFSDKKPDAAGKMYAEITTFTMGCTIWRITHYDCGEGGHHSGTFCPTLGVMIPSDIVTAFISSGCFSPGGSGDGYDGNSNGGYPGGGGGGTGTTDPETPLVITLPTTAPIYDITGVRKSTLSNPEEINPLALSPEEIIQINSNDQLRLKIYQYLAIHQAYPFDKSSGPYEVDIELQNFVEFTLKFFKENPDVSWEEFENWFMGNPELENIKEIDPNLIEYETPIIQQSLPSLSNWNTYFPKIEENGYWKPMESPLVYQLAGGSLYNSHLNDTTGAYQNACAIRGSRGLLYSGIYIPVIKIGTRQLTQKGGDNKNYILAATSFEKFMKDAFVDTPHKLEGAAANDPATVANFLKGKNGVYVIINADPRPTSQGGAGYSGHVDNIVDGICISGAYTQPKGGVKSIRVWVLN